MRAKTKKWFSPLFVLTLAVAGIFGVTAAVVDKQASDAPVVEKADAAYTALYITGEASAHGWNDTAVAAYKLNQDTDGNGYGVFTLSTGLFRFTLGNGSWSKDYGWSQMYSARGDYSLINSTFTDGGSDNNIRCITPGTYTFVYNFSSNKVQVYSGTVTRSDISGFVLTGEGSAFSTSWAPSGSILLNDSITDPEHNIFEKRDIYMSAGSKMRVAYSDHYGFTNSGWKNWGNTPTGFSLDGSNLVLTNAGFVSIYVNISYVAYAAYGTPRTITYQYKSTDNETVKTNTSDTVKQGASITLPNTSVTNYKFYGWYDSYSSGYFPDDHFVGNGGASYTVPNSNKTLYGRYIASGYAYFLLKSNNWNPTSTFRFTKDSPESGYYTFTRTFAVDDEFYIFYCNATSDDGNYHWSNVSDAGDGKGSFTDSSTNIKCTIAGTFDIILDVVGGHIYIYRSPYEDTTGYYMAGTGTFGDWTITNGMLMSSDPSGSNTAILENGTTGTSVAKDSRVQIINHEGVGTNTWYSMTLGGSYSFASEYTEGDGKKSIEFTKAGNYNFYFKIDNGTNYLYIVDVGEIANAGTLFISSPQGTIGNITIYTTNTKGDHQFNNVALTNVSGVEKKSSTLKFGNGYIYMIPLYNLRGNDAGSKCTSVTFSWTSPSSGSIALTGVDSLGGSAELYYVDGSTASTNKYVGLKVALDIDAAITAASNHSVCNVDSATAKALCDRYDAVTAAQGSSLLTSSTINTYTSTQPTYSGSADIPMVSIRYQLGKRTGISSYYSSINSFKPYELIVGEDGVDASIILIIVASSISILSITALSVLMVKKKKSANK